MAFSGLETILISVVVGLVASGVVAAKMFFTLTANFVRRTECEKEHQISAEVSTKLDLQFRMLRAVILYLDLPPEKKSEILNMRAGNKY